MPTDRPFPSLNKTEAARGGANQAGGAELLGREGVFARFVAGRRRRRPSPASRRPTTRSPRRRRRRGKDRASSNAPPRPAHEPAGIVQPALIVGIGQFGVDTLSQLRNRITTDLGSAQAVPHVRLFAIDSDANTLQAAMPRPRTGGLRGQETLHARLSCAPAITSSRATASGRPTPG